MSPLRQARLAAGLSQTDLAEAAGISRQAVGAIEAGRHRPGVDAALLLASAVGVAVEDLFAASPHRVESTLGHPSAEGGAVVAGRVGDRIVYAPADPVLSTEGWTPPNAVMRGGVPVPVAGDDLGGLVALGCDPALGLAASLLPAGGSRRLLAIAAPTAAALEAMLAGRTHAALVHGAPGSLPEPPRGAVRLHLARWRVGIALAGSGVSRGDVLGGRVEVAQREAGASSQRAFLTAVAAAGGRPPSGPVARGHLEAALRAKLGGVAAGVTMEPAAVRLGMGFEPLEEHVAEIWVAPAWADHPAVEALGGLLSSAGLRERLGLAPGYDLALTGTRLQGAP